LSLRWPRAALDHSRWTRAMGCPATPRLLALRAPVAPLCASRSVWQTSRTQAGAVRHAKAATR